MKRLFTGIAVDAEQTPRLVEKASALRAAHPELRWSDRKGWHVTLQFYGIVGEARERLLRDQLRTVENGPVEVALRGMGTFERAGVLWAGVARSEDLEGLQRKVVAAGTACGFPPEDRPYRPHITLARRRGRGGRLKLKGDGLDEEAGFDSFVATDFVLYESVTEPGGSRYVVLDRYRLGS